jgi:hypothetical protein
MEIKIISKCTVLSSGVKPIYGHFISFYCNSTDPTGVKPNWLHVQ